MKIKNWKLALLTVAGMLLFTKLGFWQLYRAHEKEILLQQFNQRSQQAISSIEAADHIDLRFHLARVQGQFDYAHSVLLDNKIVEGKIGYEVYTPFILSASKQAILVDRGFIAISDRTHLPLLTHPSSAPVIEIEGMLNTAPRYVAFGQMIESKENTWPIRVEYVHLKKIGALLHRPLLPYILQLKPENPNSFLVKWQIVSMAPEKHRGYALQWFAFATTLLILFVVLNRSAKKQ